jgi:hypothetical protein
MKFEWDPKKAEKNLKKHGVTLRKVKRTDELRPEYKREDLGVGVRGKYFEDYSKGTKDEEKRTI